MSSPTESSSSDQTAARTSDPKAVLITGASTGFGRLTALTLARRGHTVFASMRGVSGKNAGHAESIRDIADREGLELHVVELDVTNQADIDLAVDHVIGTAGRLDVLVNNAGIFGMGLAETYTTDQIRFMYETNVFGPFALSRAVLPQMRAQRQGLLLHISSGVGRMVVPAMSLYASSKFALEAIGEALRYETASLGIDSVLVEPGAFKTEIFGKGYEPAEPERASDYGELATIGEQFAAGLGAYFESEAYRGPEAVVESIVELIEAEPGSRPTRVAVGADVESVRELNTLAAEKQQGFLEAFGLAPFAPLA